MLLRLRPDLAITLLRGNVETRLAKLARGEIDATILALAGLKRLGLADGRRGCSTPPISFLRSARARSRITARRGRCAGRGGAATDPRRATARCALACERALLQVLDGSCRTPIGGHAWLDNGDTASARDHPAAGRLAAFRD